MKLIERFLELINIEMEEPTVFGFFHLFCVLLVALSCFALFLRFRDSTDRTFRILIAVMAGTMILGEVIKQTFYQMSVADGTLTFDYSWADFPFQLCSTPLYVLPWLSILPDCRLRDLAASYTMTFGLIGGVMVYLTPKTVFGTVVFGNFQTMIHHGLQIVTGVYTAFYYRRRINYRFFFSGVAVFAVMLTVANLINTVGYDILLANGMIAEGDTLNMFYISPRADQTVPVASDLLKSFPPLVYIAGYFVVLSLIAGLIAYLTDLLHKESRKRMAARRVSD